MSYNSDFESKKLRFEEELDDVLGDIYNDRLNAILKFYKNNYHRFNDKERDYYYRKLMAFQKQSPYKKSLEKKFSEFQRYLKPKSSKNKLYSANANLLQFMDNSRFEKSAAQESKIKEKEPKNYYSNAHMLHFINDDKFNDKSKNKNKKLNKNKLYSANANYLQFMNNSRFEKSASQQIKHKEANNLELDKDLFNILNVSNMSLKDFHHKSIDPENLPEAYQLLNLLKNTDPGTSNIVFHFKAELPDGTIVDEYRYFTSESFNLISRIIENDCLMLEEDFGYELGQITSIAKLLSIEVIDLDQGPTHRRRRRLMGFFNWIIKSNPFDLSRYQIYQNFEDIDPELCFIHALREKGVDELTLSNISNDLDGIDRITMETVEFIAKKYNLFINIMSVYPDKFYNNRYPREFKEENRPWIDLCFFTIQNQDYPEHIIPYDEDIKFNINYFKCNEDQKLILNKYPVDKLVHFSRFGKIDERFELKRESINSIQLLRDLHKFSSQALIPLTNDQKNELKFINHNRNKEINFNISPTDYRPWSKYGELNRIDQIFKNIPNLYQVSGNVENIIRKCVSGLAPRISKKNNLIDEELVCLDIISNHANAASQINIPLGIPKRYSRFGKSASQEIDLSKVNSAYLLINIQSIGKYQKYDAVKDLQIGNRFVDLLTLNQLIKYHSITYEIIDGVYFDSGSVNISKEIHEIFEIRKQAKIDNNLELANQIKRLLTVDLYGNLMKNKKSVGTIYFERKEEAYDYIYSHENAFELFSRDNQYIVHYKKRFTNNYNLIHIGSLILRVEQARRAIISIKSAP